MVNLPTPSSKLKGTDRKIISQGFSRTLFPTNYYSRYRDQKRLDFKIGKVKARIRKLDRIPF